MKKYQWDVQMDQIWGAQRKTAIKDFIKVCLNNWTDESSFTEEYNMAKPSFIHSAACR